MPIRKVAGGYKFGGKGHVYASRKGAERQAAAAYANGYQGKSSDSDSQSLSDEEAMLTDRDDRDSEGGYTDPFEEIRRLVGSSARLTKGMSKDASVDRSVKLSHESDRTVDAGKDDPIAQLKKLVGSTAKISKAKLDNHRGSEKVHTFPGKESHGADYGHKKWQRHQGSSNPVSWHPDRGKQIYGKPKSGRWADRKVAASEDQTLQTALNRSERELHTIAFGYDPIDVPLFKAIQARHILKQHGWTRNSHKKWWDHVSDQADKGELEKGPHTNCFEKLQGHVKDPHALCAWQEHEATGKWPAERVAEERSKEDEAMPMGPKASSKSPLARLHALRSVGATSYHGQPMNQRGHAHNAGKELAGRAGSLTDPLRKPVAPKLHLAVNAIDPPQRVRPTLDCTQALRKSIISLSRLLKEKAENFEGGSDKDDTPETGSKNPHAVILGRRGGEKGGPARARALTGEQRSDIAEEAADVRWGNRTG